MIGDFGAKPATEQLHGLVRPGIDYSHSRDALDGALPRHAGSLLIHLFKPNLFALAKAIGVPPNRITAILKDERGTGAGDPAGNVF
jgi:hypothetical protein